MDQVAAVLLLSHSTALKQTDWSLLLNPKAPGLGEAAFSMSAWLPALLSFLSSTSIFQWPVLKDDSEAKWALKLETQWLTPSFEWRAKANSRWKDGPMVWFQRQCLEEWVSHVFLKRQNLSVKNSYSLFVNHAHALLAPPYPHSMLPIQIREYSPTHFSPVTQAWEGGLI